MKLRFNYWQLFLLFLPFIIGFQLFHVPYTSPRVYNIAVTSLNLLFNISPCFIIGYQSYLVITFNKTINGARWFTINAFIPVIFTLVYFTYVVTITILRPPHLNSRLGPIEQTNWGFVPNAIEIFLLHAIITFFVVNNIYVSRQIKKIPDDVLRDQLSFDFFRPMKKLKNMSYIVIAGILILSIVIDIFMNGLIPNQN